MLRPMAFLHGTGRNLSYLSSKDDQTTISFMNASCLGDCIAVRAGTRCGGAPYDALTKRFCCLGRGSGSVEILS